MNNEEIQELINEYDSFYDIGDFAKIMVPLNKGDYISKIDPENQEMLTKHKSSSRILARTFDRLKFEINDFNRKLDIEKILVEEQEHLLQRYNNL